MTERDAALVESLAEAPEAAIFLDASAVDRRIDYPMWDELLRCPRRVFLIGRVLRELAPHFAKVPDHPLFKAIKVRNPALVLHPEPKSGAPGFNALLYYLNLLANRRTVLQRAISRYERNYGHMPDAAANAQIVATIQRDFGERGMLLCKKPLSPLFSDETLVYLAVEHAVRTGQPTLILTGDHDVEEQFFKIIELITMHYYAMLIAREYLADFARFRPRPISAETAAASGLFHSATLLDLGGRRVQDFRPETIQFVSVACCLVAGGNVSHVPYGAETAMSEVLDIKDRTGGRSTELLGSRDVHAYFMPELPGERRDYSALISHDVLDTVPDTGIGLAKLDSLAAINTKLSMSSVVSTSASSSVLLRRRKLRTSSQRRHAARSPA